MDRLFSEHLKNPTLLSFHRRQGRHWRHVLRVRCPQFLHHVFPSFGELGPGFDKPVTPLAQPARDLSGNRKDLLPLFQGVIRGDQGSTIDRRLDHDDAKAEAADQPVALGEVPPEGRCSEWKLTQQGAPFRDRLPELPMLCWIDDICPRSQDGDGSPTRS